MYSGTIMEEIEDKFEYIQLEAFINFYAFINMPDIDINQLLL